MKFIVFVTILVFVVGCASRHKQVEREIRAHELTASKIIEIVKIHFAQNHSALKPIAVNTLIGDVVSNYRKTRNTKVTIRLDAEDGRLLVRYSNIANADTYISRKQIYRLL